MSDVMEPMASCDTLAVRTSAGGVVFAKNSDRPAHECQPLHANPARRHPPSSTVGTQYLTMPQVAETLTVLGSRPAWLWGYEHGVNEARVAIGNEAIYTREPVPATGLLGMDLVRLGLERSHTAIEAVEIVTGLLETYGQGGAAVATGDRSYHNSFLIADPTTIYVIETSTRHWVVKEMPAGAAISNLMTIGADWTRICPSLLGADTRPLDFRARFEDPSARLFSQARYLASCLVVQDPEKRDVPALMRHLRDHFEGGTTHVPDPSPTKLRPRSICQHPAPGRSETTASMIVDLASPAGPPIAWCSMATPCTSPFIPVRVGAPLPPPLVSDSSEDGLWWKLRRLQRYCDQDPGIRTSRIREQWAELEEAWRSLHESSQMITDEELAAIVHVVAEKATLLLDSSPR